MIIPALLRQSRAVAMRLQGVCCLYPPVFYQKDEVEPTKPTYLPLRGCRLRGLVVWLALLVIGGLRF